VAVLFEGEEECAAMLILRADFSAISRWTSGLRRIIRCAKEADNFDRAICRVEVDYQFGTSTLLARSGFDVNIWIS
jgi:hypothetical protein